MNHSESSFSKFVERNWSSSHSLQFSQTFMTAVSSGHQRNCSWTYSVDVVSSLFRFLERSFGLQMARHSKLQKQVLALYRQFLRAGQDKPGFIPRIRDEFRENARIKKTDVMHIEYLYRRAQRQLEQLKDVNTKQLGSFSKPAEKSWPLASDLWPTLRPVTKTCQRLGHY